MLTNYMDGPLMNSRKIVPLCVAAALGCASLSAFADDYRAEVQLNATRIDPDGDFPHIDTFGVNGTYYLEPVKTDGLPLAEAAFLGKSSYVGASASRAEFDGAHTDFYSAGIGYYVPNTIFFGSLGAVHSKFGGESDTTWVGTFGVTPFDGLLVTTSFDEDGWDPNVSAKYVGKMANSHYYSIAVSAVDPDEGDTDVGLDFDYYLDNTFSLGAGYGSAADTFTVRAEKFFTRSFAVGGNVSTGDGGEAFGATVTWRF
jgi:hypothetical protein